MAKGNTSAFDLVIIGGGPAGYVGAIRATQLGLSVACIERDKLGGVCLNWGCIPTKALLAQAEFYYRLTREAEEWGVEADNVRHHWEKVIGRSRTVAGNLNKGIHGLFKKNKITHIEGHAKITKAGPPATIEIHDKPDHVAQTVTARHVMIATGAAPRELPFAPFDGKDIIASKEAMTLTEQPKRLVVIGAGAIGMEFAYFYNAFGTEVTVIEMLDRVVPNEDSDVSKAVAKAFKRQGIDCRTGLKTTAIEKTDEGTKVTDAWGNDEKKRE